MSYSDEVLSTLRRRWRSKSHVGAAKPVVRGYVRTVKLSRKFRPKPLNQIYSRIPNWKGPNIAWEAWWQPATGWTALPNIRGVEVDQDFEQNGVANATIEIDNLEMEEKSGVEGIYHALQRGFFSPYRGYEGARPAIGEQNEWFRILADKSSQIIVLAGYGDEVVPIFEGLVNDLDMTSRPDIITITARDAAQTLTDQHVFGNAKARGTRDPITFVDRRQADNKKAVGLTPRASSQSPRHVARFVLDEKHKTEWKSRDYNHPRPASDLPWIQIGVPHGRYESIRLHPAAPGMTAYIAVRARDKNAPGGNGAKKHYTGVKYDDNEWINEGKGHVPGTTIPYVRKIENIRAKDQWIQLEEFGYDLGDDSKIRVYFHNLDLGRQNQGNGRAYHARVITFKAIRRRLQQQARRHKWILVDDLADVVRTVFQWAGLNNWEVETTGVRLKEKTTFNRGDFLMDIIQQASEAAGYVFYCKPRETFDESPAALASLAVETGSCIAVWRQNNSMRTGAGVNDPIEFLHENETIEGIETKITDEPLAYNIRVRGRTIDRTFGGRQLQGDRIHRWMYVYRPPWSREDHLGRLDFRNANIKKYVVHHDNKLRTLDDCKIAALFIAYREAMESAQAVVEGPCMPTIHLDNQVSLYDTGTALSTRLYVASRQISITTGEQGTFKMALGGALIDAPDIEQIRNELIRALRNSGYNPGVSQWERRHFGNIYRQHDKAIGPGVPV